MRFCIVVLACLSAALSPCSAQTGAPSSSITPEQRRAVSDERAAEVKREIEAARERQNRFDRQNTDLWARWVYAVCVGCDEARVKVRIVYTNPLRVLAGIPAAVDDGPIRPRRRPALASRRITVSAAGRTGLAGRSRRHASAHATSRPGGRWRSRRASQPRIARAIRFTATVTSSRGASERA